MINLIHKIYHDKIVKPKKPAQKYFMAELVFKNYYMASLNIWNYKHYL